MMVMMWGRDKNGKEWREEKKRRESNSNMEDFTRCFLYVNHDSHNLAQVFLHHITPSSCRVMSSFQ